MEGSQSSVFCEVPFLDIFVSVVSLHCESLLAAVDLIKPPRGKRCLHRFTKSLSDCDEMADFYTFEIFEEETPLTWTSRLCNPVLIPEFGPNFQG